MNAKKIDYMLSIDPYTKPTWKGFLAPDVQIVPPFPGTYIINTAPSYTEGEHWCCLFVYHNHNNNNNNNNNEKKKMKFCEFFDSFGQPPYSYGLLESIQPGCETIFYNKKMVQGMTAKTCGHHCIFFVTQKARKMKTLDILEKYSDGNFRQNDDMVYNYVLNNFGSLLAKIEED